MQMELGSGCTAYLVQHRRGCITMLTSVFSVTFLRVQVTLLVSCYCEYFLVPFIISNKYLENTKFEG